MTGVDVGVSVLGMGVTVESSKGGWLAQEARSRLKPALQLKMDKMVIFIRWKFLKIFLQVVVQLKCAVGERSWLHSTSHCVNLTIRNEET